MTKAILEHINVTVTDAKATADVLCALFDWNIRWHGDAKDGGITYHVGSADSYVAVYSNGGTDALGNSYKSPGAMNHIGVVVGDIKDVEARVTAAGYTPHSHGDYEPGLRFYFDGPDGIEIEVVNYTS